MAIRCFKRAVWQRARTSGWPDGYEPLAVPMDECRTLARFDTEDEAIEFCEARNKKWRKHTDRVRNGTASETQRRTYYTADRYEWTRED